MERERAELDAGAGTHEVTDRERAELETVEHSQELKGSDEAVITEVPGIGLMHELPGHDHGARAM